MASSILGRVLLALLMTAGMLTPWRTSAQERPAAPPVASGEKADGLFVATIPAPGTEDESGKPALASMDPVAFFVNGQIRGCVALHPAPTEDPVPPPVLNTLNRLYAPGHEYTISFAGAPWGTARTTGSPIDDDLLDISGEFKASGAFAHVPEKGLTASIWTGKPLPFSHPAIQALASPDERRIFLESASSVYGAHHVPVRPNSIHSSAIVKRQLRAGHTALIGNMIVQLAADKPRTYYSYRLFLVIEETNGSYEKVLEHYRRTIASVLPDDPLPKPGTLVDEEAQADHEQFADNVPLFSGEPDAIVTKHTYYEDWGYSIYRFIGGSYRLIYSGCGGGD